MVILSFAFISDQNKGIFLPSGHNKLENPDLMLKTRISTYPVPFPEIKTTIWQLLRI